MTEKSFLSDILKRIARAGPFLGPKNGPVGPELISLCEILLGDRGEASGLKCALKILNGYEQLDDEAKLSFFQDVTNRFGVDHEALATAVADWKEGDNASARTVYLAAEPRSQELIRRLNRVPGATARLVNMRAELLKFLKQDAELKWLDMDFRHLFSSWFNRGFLEITQIDWTTSASVLEKIIAYEAVHEIKDWDDLRQRVAEADRRLFAFFHPAMPDDPLIFVEVALTKTIPGSIAAILSNERDVLDPSDASAAVFYSISNCQKGLRGISFGNFLIKQVVAELQRELPGLSTYVTLSPVPALRRWVGGVLQGEDEQILNLEEQAIIRANAEHADLDPALAAKLAARYLVNARSNRGTVYDPVAHFHLGNGAILHKVHAQADMSDQGVANSWGVMVNYLYDEARIEDHHQSYATDGSVAASSEVRSLASSKIKG